MFLHTRINLLALGLAVLLAATSPAVAWQSEAELLATLNDADASFFDKTIACKELAVVGGEKAVPVLAGLLDDEKLSHYARYGLEPNPSAKVDKVLTEALSTIKGRRLIGMINSLGNRGKAEAIGPLAKKLDDADRAVARAAAHSIARLGTPEASKTLDGVMSAEFAAAGLVCGRTLAEQGHTEAAAAMLVKLSKMAEAPEHVRLAALVQAVDILDSKGLDMLADSLASDDDEVLEAALRTARLISPSDACKAALDAIAGASPEKTARLVTLLGDLKERAGLAAVVDAAESANSAVRVAALEALATLGGAEHVALLMDAATDELEEVSQKAQEALSALSGDAVDRAVLDLLDDAARRATVIRLIGKRRITEAVPKLRALVEGPDRLDVIGSLGETVSLDELDVLGRMLGTEAAELREAVQSAVHAACYRMPDRDATAKKLAGYLRGASEQTVEFLMEELRVTGGPEALATVAKAALGDNAIEKEYATRALGEWLDTSVSPVLLELAKAEGEGKYGVRGMRGYIRLARQFSMSEEERIKMLRTVLASARDTEKKLVLEVLERYPSLEGLKVAVEMTDIESLKADAARTALVLSEKIRGHSREVKDLLAQVGQETVQVEIIKAEYGAGEKTKDVTATLKQHVRGFPLIVLPSDRYNSAFGGDPIPGTPKVLKIDYRIDGKPGSVTLRENAPVLLPMPK